MAIYRVPITMSWSGQSEGAINVWHIRTLAGASTGLDAMVGHLKDFYTSLRNLYPSSVTIAAPPLAVSVGAEPEYAQLGDPWRVTGSGGAGFIAAPTALTVTWYTASATRSGRGRTFLGPLTAGLNSADGTPSDENLPAIRAAAQSLVSASLSDGNGAIVVYSQVQSVGRDIVRSNVRDVWSVMRSRRN
jgi:hypothetical protein